MRKTKISTFDECSYLSQVRKLRRFAEKALETYSIGKYELKFIQHGENCTFKVLTKQQNYLLRIHRAHYHSRLSIEEELAWLNHLDQQSSIDVQAPVLNNDGQFVSRLSFSPFSDRFFDLLTWKNGFIKHKKSRADFFEVGSLLAELQNNGIKSKHRHFWTADGLAGQETTFGSVRLLKKDYPQAYNILEPCRKEVLSALKNYQTKKTAKMGLMHADLHFGNMIWNKKGISPIDFDDCGYGIQVYDLAVNIYNSSNFFKKIGKKEARMMKYSLIDGFNSKKPLSEEDISLIPILIRARDILMIIWLYTRQDNPILKGYLEKELMNKVRRIRTNSEYQI